MDQPMTERLALLLTAKRVQQHQARIDRARDAGLLLDAPFADRSGADQPGFHLTPRGKALGALPPAQGAGQHHQGRFVVN